MIESDHHHHIVIAVQRQLAGSANRNSAGTRFHASYQTNAFFRHSTYLHTLAFP
jgi:hypothetical protein